MKIAYVMLVLTCEGHTNAECYPSVTYYETKEACTAAMTIPERKERVWTFWADEERTIPAKLMRDRVCFATVLEATP